MRKLGKLVAALVAFAGALAATDAAALVITDTAVSLSNPPTLIINGSGLAGGTPAVTLGPYPALAVVTQTATQVTALLPANVTLQGTYLVSLQLMGSGSRGVAVIASDEAWVTVGSTGLPGPPGATGRPAGNPGAARFAGTEG